MEKTERQLGWERMQEKVILALKNKAWELERERPAGSIFEFRAAVQFRDMAKAIESWNFAEEEARDGLR
jgi:hypothetical protein